MAGMTKIIAGLVVFVLTLIGIYFVFTTDKAPAIKSGSEQATTTLQPKVLSWSFKDEDIDEAIGAPRTSVALIVDDTSYDAGTYNGSCQTITANGGVDGTGLAAGELTGVQCWFAGGGDEIGVFTEGDVMVLKHGELGEPQGDGTGAFRGNFTTLLTI
jgi:hypothetical protein